MTDIAKGKRIYRFQVPVDDGWHQARFHGDILAVWCRQAHEVEFWAVEPDKNSTLLRSFSVVGTGHQMPADVVYRGTAVAPGGMLVWHLVEQK